MINFGQKMTLNIEEQDKCLNLNNILTAILCNNRPELKMVYESNYISAQNNAKELMPQNWPTLRCRYCANYY